MVKLPKMYNLEQTANGNVLVKNVDGNLVRILIGISSITKHSRRKNIVFISEKAKATASESVVLNCDEIAAINNIPFTGTRNDLLLALSDLFTSGSSSNASGTSSSEASNQEINEDMSVITTSHSNGITRIDARQSTTNGVVTGGVSGKHWHSFAGQFNRPKLNGATAKLTLEAGENAVIIDGVGEKDIAGNKWDSCIYSAESFNPLTDNFAFSWPVESIEGTIREFGGFDNNPVENQSYTSIEYGIYQVDGYVSSNVYEKGKAIKIPNYTNYYLRVGDQLGVMCINQQVSYFVLRNGVATIIYTSEELISEPLYFKAAFSRGNGSSGESRIGNVVYYPESEINSFSIELQGNARDTVSDEDALRLKKEAGIVLLSGSTYSLLEFSRLDGTRYKTGNVFNPVDVLSDYRGLANQAMTRITFPNT